MIGETTLAMLYVPLLFYLFDRLAEGKREGPTRTAPRTPRLPPPARGRRRGAGAAAPREGD